MITILVVGLCDHHSGGWAVITILAVGLCEHHFGGWAV